MDGHRILAGLRRPDKVQFCFPPRKLPIKIGDSFALRSAHNGLDGHRCSGQAGLAGQSASINPAETRPNFGDNFALRKAHGRRGPGRGSRLDKVHQVTPRRLPQQIGDSFALRSAQG